jgi:hypothetical protein
MVVPDTFPIGMVSNEISDDGSASNEISDDGSGSPAEVTPLPVVRQSAQVTFPPEIDACEASVQENLKTALAAAYTQASSNAVTYSASDIIYLSVSGCSTRRLSPTHFGATARLRSLTESQMRSVESLLSVQNLAEAQSMNQDLSNSSNLDAFKTEFGQTMGSSVTMDAATVEVDVVQELEVGEFSAVAPPAGQTWDTISPDFDLDAYVENLQPGGVNMAAAHVLSTAIKLIAFGITGLQLFA